MSHTESHSFTRYLAAKRTVDDRALNGHVWGRFTSEVNNLAESALAESASHPLHFVELGAGIGTMIERLLEAGLLLGVTEYTAVDSSAENNALAAARLISWANQRGIEATSMGVVEEGSNEWVVRYEWLRETNASCPDLTIRLLTADAFSFLAKAAAQPASVLLAHAFLDLVHLPRALTAMKTALAPEALLYLTINFDGATILEPGIDPALDDRIERLYHATMDRRTVDSQPSGDSRTGRHLYHALLEHGYDVLAAGASDWVVGPTAQGYIGDEAYFLHFIVDTIAGALKDNPALDRAAFLRWVAGRHQQIDNQQLLFIAHQMDYLARAPSSR